MAFLASSAVIKGGFFEVNGVGPLTPISGRSALRRRVAQWMSKKGMYAMREDLRTLDGAVAGTVATKTYTQIQNSVELGGRRTIETVNLISRATTAQDVTDTKADLLSLAARTTKAAQVNLNRNPLGSPGLF
jgi:hypothetical protein